MAMMMPWERRGLLLLLLEVRLVGLEVVPEREFWVVPAKIFWEVELGRRPRGEEGGERISRSGRFWQDLKGEDWNLPAKSLLLAAALVGAGLLASVGLRRNKIDVWEAAQENED